MRPRLAWIGPIALALAACAETGPQRARGAPPRAPAGAPPGAAIFASTCLGCHDEPDPPRPDLAAPMTPPMATRALRALLDDRMPPPTSSVRAKLTVARERALVDWLCRGTGRDQGTCAQLVDYVTRPALMRGGPTIAQVLRSGGAEVTEQTASLLLFASPPSRRAVSDPGRVATLLVAVIEVCRPAPGADAVRACIERFLRLGLAPPAPAAR